MVNLPGLFKSKTMKRINILVLALGLAVQAYSQQPVLQQQEKDAILYMREEEKLARDVYDSMYEKWKVNPFGNIRQSERMHMSRMLTLVNAYGLTDPVTMLHDRPGVFADTLLQRYYHELVGTGTGSLAGALRAGARIEELDIADLDLRIAQTKQPDILATYGDLRHASENHLRAFVRRLKMEGAGYEPVILSKEVFDQIIAAQQGGHGHGGW